MFQKKSVILFATIWILLAIVALPANASAVTPLQTQATVLIDPLPIFEDQFTVQQAHIAWIASKEDAGMQATLAYIRSINGSTTTLVTIHENFREAHAYAGMADSNESLESFLKDFRTITQSFRDETYVQMKTSRGNPDSLRRSTQSAVAISARVKSSEDQYWGIRKMTVLADFDTWVDHAGAMRAILGGDGYEITTAQEKLTEIITMRNELATALNTRNNTGIEQTDKKSTLHPSDSSRRYGGSG